MSSIWCAVSAWRWDIIGGSAGVISAFSALVILYFVDKFDLVRRRRRLLRPGDAYFVIPSTIHHICEYAKQNELEHRLHTIILPPHSEFIIDFVLIPSLEFDITEIAIGCDGDLSDKPYAIEQFNRFIEAGHRRHVVPGVHNYDDYLDKHHYYHAVYNSQFNVGNAKAMGFKIKTLSTGVYHMNLPFSGSTVRGEFAGLTVVVSKTLNAPMRCIDPDHQHRDCAVRIRSRTQS